MRIEGVIIYPVAIAVRVLGSERQRVILAEKWEAISRQARLEASRYQPVNDANEMYNDTQLGKADLFDHAAAMIRGQRNLPPSEPLNR